MYIELQPTYNIDQHNFTIGHIMHTFVVWGRHVDTYNEHEIEGMY